MKVRVEHTWDLVQTLRCCRISGVHLAFALVSINLCLGSRLILDSTYLICFEYLSLNVNTPD